MSKNKVEYNELAKARSSKSRNIVISSCSRGGFTIAQQIVVEEENNKSTAVFMKGAFHVDDISCLYELRDALNLALKKAEEGPEDGSWDDQDC